MKKRIFLHIGTHKTGTTSIQKLCQAESDNLMEKGYFFVRDSFLFCDDRSTNFFAKMNAPQRVLVRNHANCIQFAHVFVRQDLGTPMRIRKNMPILSAGDQEWLAKVIWDRLQAITADNIVVSAEAFSFIRTADEIDLLYDTLREFEVIPVCFFREPKDWLRSWRGQVGKGRLAEIGGGSSSGIFDFRPDSWLVDHDKIRECFGESGIYLNYERSLEKYGSTVPAFIEALGLDPRDFPAASEIWQNRSG